MSKDTMELVPLGDNAMALKEVLDIFAEEMDGLGTIPMPRVSTPAGGGLAFTIGEDDDAEVAKTLKGVIVAHHPSNVYYALSIEDSGGNTAPTCASNDGKTGIVFDTGEACSCATCPRNQFAGDGRKECSNRHNVYLLREGDMLPTLISLPSTSLANFKSLIAKQVVLKRRRCTSIIVEASLEKAESRGGQAFSRYKWSVVGELGADDAAKMEQFGEEFKQYIAANNASRQPVQQVQPVQEEKQSEDVDIIDVELPFKMI